MHTDRLKTLSTRQTYRLKAALAFVATAIATLAVFAWARRYDWTTADDFGEATVYSYSRGAVIGVLALGFAYCTLNFGVFTYWLKNKLLAYVLALAFVPFILISAHGMHCDVVEVSPEGFTAKVNWGFSRQGFPDRFVRFDELTRIRMTSKQHFVRGRGGGRWQTNYYLCFETEEAAPLELEIDGPVKRRAVSRILEIAEEHGIPVSHPYKKNSSCWVAERGA